MASQQSVGVNSSAGGVGAGRKHKWGVGVRNKGRGGEGHRRLGPKVTKVGDEARLWGWSLMMDCWLTWWCGPYPRTREGLQDDTLNLERAQVACQRGAVCGSPWFNFKGLHFQGGAKSKKLDLGFQFFFSGLSLNQPANVIRHMSILGNMMSSQHHSQWLSLLNESLSSSQCPTSLAKPSFLVALNKMHAKWYYNIKSITFTLLVFYSNWWICLGILHFITFLIRNA